MKLTLEDAMQDNRVDQCARLLLRTLKGSYEEAEKAVSDIYRNAHVKNPMFWLRVHERIQAFRITA